MVADFFPWVVAVRRVPSTALLCGVCNGETLGNAHKMHYMWIECPCSFLGFPYILSVDSVQVGTWGIHICLNFIPKVKLNVTNKLLNFDTKTSGRGVLPSSCSPLFIDEIRSLLFCPKASKPKLRLYAEHYASRRPIFPLNF